MVPTTILSHFVPFNSTSINDQAEPMSRYVPNTSDLGTMLPVVPIIKPVGKGLATVQEVRVDGDTKPIHEEHDLHTVRTNIGIDTIKGHSSRNFTGVTPRNLSGVFVQGGLVHPLTRIELPTLKSNKTMTSTYNPIEIVSVYNFSGKINQTVHYLLFVMFTIICVNY
ncbi:hypothetical protein DdX_08572 [Ditylenchus destructor]|uniref:Uncharacterized protein n=1 Tax=Ditylenchus destructor TaxID=166010 RepID=A0AAD4N1C9_9BILA|nr:hypothetical protein DdX_08572 [Ditylenchus destructor]